MAGPLLDIWGNYDRLYNQYTTQAKRYSNLADIYNKNVDAWNTSIISDAGAYDRYTGNYSGSGPYTTYNGQTIGRTGTPISTYQTDPTGYNTSYKTIYGEDISPEQAYDLYGNLNEGVNKTVTPIYSGTNETTYVDPTTGMASVYSKAPGEFNETMPTAPEMPMGDRPNTSLGNIDPTQLYQTVFGRSTPDALSNEAWSLANLTSPFFSNIDATPYETGAVNRANNPLYYMSPTELTTGQINQPEASSMYDQNPYY